MSSNVLKMAAGAPSPEATAPEGAQPAYEFGTLALKRDFDARRLNPVLNHPEVRPWVSVPGQGALDAACLLADLRNVALMTDAGGLLFVQIEPGVYEVHVQFLPSLRGAAAADIIRQAFAHMFLQTDCVGIYARVPAHNRAVLGMVRHVRMVHEFDRPKAWPTAAGPVDLGFWALRYWDWLWGAGGLIDKGRWLLDRLGVADTDPARDRLLGAAVLQLQAGQIGKAVALYNSWARIADYQPMDVVSAAPLVVEIGSARILLADDDAERIECLSPPQS